MKKKIVYTILFIIIIVISFGFYFIRKFNNNFFKEKSAYLEYTFQSKPIQFDWIINKKGIYVEKQAAMFVPVKIDSLSHQLFMQFDTGAPHSFIYENDLNSLKALGKEFEEVQIDNERFIKEIQFNLGGNEIELKMIKILANYGHKFDKKDTLRKIGIGTIGSDFLMNRTTAIDFKKQKIQVFDERPNWMKTKINFTNFDFVGRRIMLPTKIDNKNYEFLYDSGCSAFGLITTKIRFDKYTKKETVLFAYHAKSWSSKMAISSKMTEKQFQIANKSLSLQRVSYVDMYTWAQPLVTPFTRIGGWLGNQPFLESVLIIDTKAQEFAIIDAMQYD